MATSATFDGHFTFRTSGGKISRDIKATEQELADHLRACGEAWIVEHTAGRVTGKGDVTVAYHYGWGTPARSKLWGRRPRKAV